MQAPIIAYVRKGCKTCKRALDYMRDRGFGFEMVDLIEKPLAREELEGIIELLGIPPKELLRTRDRMYRELGLRDGRLSDEELIGLMVKYQGLIKRPILMRGDRAVLALKPEEVDRLGS